MSEWHQKGVQTTTIPFLLIQCNIGIIAGTGSNPRKTEVYSTAVPQHKEPQKRLLYPPNPPAVCPNRALRAAPPPYSLCPRTRKTQTHTNTATRRPNSTKRPQKKTSTCSPSRASQADTNQSTAAPRTLLLPLSWRNRAPPNAGIFYGSAGSPISFPPISQLLLSFFFPFPPPQVT